MVLNFYFLILSFDLEKKLAIYFIITTSNFMSAAQTSGATHIDFSHQTTNCALGETCFLQTNKLQMFIYYSYYFIILLLIIYYFKQRSRSKSTTVSRQTCWRRTRTGWRGATRATPGTPAAWATSTTRDTFQPIVCVCNILSWKISCKRDVFKCEELNA